MECWEALEYLEAEGLCKAAEIGPQLRTARQHLESCAECQSAWNRQQAWSSRLVQVMGRVDVPQGLQERLQAAVDNAETTAAATIAETIPAGTKAPVAPSEARPRRYGRRALLGGGAIALCLGLAAGIFWWQDSPPVPMSELWNGSQVVYSELPEFQYRFDPRLPASWSAIFTLEPDLIRGYPASGPGVGQIALIPFQMTTRGRREAIRGRLLMLPRRRLASVEEQNWAADFTHAEVRYLPGGHGAYAVWAEDDLIFVCLVPSGPADLHRFQRILAGARSLT